jgi:hypothetical protein
LSESQTFAGVTTLSGQARNVALLLMDGCAGGCSQQTGVKTKVMPSLQQDIPKTVNHES